MGSWKEAQNSYLGLCEKCNAGSLLRSTCQELSHSLCQQTCTCLALVLCHCIAKDFHLAFYHSFKFLSVFLLPFEASSHSTPTSMLLFISVPTPLYIPTVLPQPPQTMIYEKRSLEIPKLSIFWKTATNTRIILGNWNRVKLITLCMLTEHRSAINEG